MLLLWLMETPRHAAHQHHGVPCLIMLGMG